MEGLLGVISTSDKMRTLLSKPLVCQGEAGQDGERFQEVRLFQGWKSNERSWHEVEYEFMCLRHQAIVFHKYYSDAVNALSTHRLSKYWNTCVGGRWWNLILLSYKYGNKRSNLLHAPNPENVYPILYLKEMGGHKLTRVLVNEVWKHWRSTLLNYKKEKQIPEGFHHILQGIDTRMQEYGSDVKVMFIADNHITSGYND